MQEVSRRIVSNIDRIIEDNFAVLHSMATVSKTVGGQSMEDLSEVLLNYQEKWHYERVMLIDAQGRAYDVDGTEAFLSLDDNVRQKLISGQDSMSTAQMINNKEHILFSVPVQGIELEGKPIVSLVATYDPLYFDKSLSMESFNQQAYS